ncbi:hypothetical protein EDB85DRAFT_1889850 [Lactarius pseudohatsudake]|nr:hypothetical protein EDB85DRAFT_1889850 [Lactarius pseudohatsudake]
MSGRNTQQKLSSYNADSKSLSKPRQRRRTWVCEEENKRRDGNCSRRRSWPRTIRKDQPGCRSWRTLVQLVIVDRTSTDLLASWHATIAAVLKMASFVSPNRSGVGNEGLASSPRGSPYKRPEVKVRTDVASQEGGEKERQRGCVAIALRQHDTWHNLGVRMRSRQNRAYRASKRPKQRTSNSITPPLPLPAQVLVSERSGKAELNDDDGKDHDDGLDGLVTGRSGDRDD